MRPLYDETPAYEAIVNSNALGVAMVSKSSGYRVTFISRHAVRRLTELGLVDGPAESLLGAPADRLVDCPLLRAEALADPSNYPGAVRAETDGRDVELAISPVFDLDDVYLGVMITFRDRTEDARREADALQFQEHIGDLISEAGSKGSDAEDARRQLGSVVDNVEEAGNEISRLLGQLGYLNGQAKLLALNASIEVHRTADAEAFGVVADEMRDLADRMAATVAEVTHAAKQIDNLSTTVHSASEDIGACITGLIDSQRAMETSIRENTGS
ncbi:MAG: methyl-accepting chemotaxis protein [Actinomycetota bacterium]